MNERWRDICTHVASEMATHVKDYVTSIAMEKTESEGKLMGSGTYLSLNGSNYILTNEHVARCRLKASLGHTLKDGDYMYRITNPFQCVPYPVDAALARIETPVFERGERKAVPASRIREAFSPEKEELLCVHGFPAEKSRMSALAGGLLSRSMPYLSQEMALPSKYDPYYSFAIHYPFDLPLMTTEDKERSLPDPHGMSGSPVWDTGYVARQGQNWTADDATLIGMVHAWDQGAHALIGTRIERITEFLINALRREAAYFRWLDRGKPQADDWSDWFCAEGEIQCLT